jgi:hypothetical protein
MRDLVYCNNRASMILDFLVEVKIDPMSYHLANMKILKGLKDL